jgi:hypothetical protein
MSDEKQQKKFRKLPPEWCEAMLGADDFDIDKGIKTAAISLVTLELAKQFDEDLISLQEQLSTAQEQYKEGKKENLLKIEFLIEVLRSRGRDVPDAKTFIKQATAE